MKLRAVMAVGLLAWGVTSACKVKECNQDNLEACPSKQCASDGTCVPVTSGSTSSGGTTLSSSSTPTSGASSSLGGSGSSSLGFSSSLGASSSVGFSSSRPQPSSLAQSSSAAAGSSSSLAASGGGGSSSSGVPSSSSGVGSSSAGGSSSSAPLCAASQMTPPELAALSDDFEAVRAGWTVGNEDSATGGYGNGGLDGGFYVIRPYVNTGWYGDSATGFHLYKEVHGDFRMRAEMRVLHDAGVTPFSNGGIIFRAAQDCVPPEQNKVWFLLDHGFQDQTGGSSGGLQQGVLWKQNVLDGGNFQTTRRFTANNSPTMAIVMCRSGNSVMGCFNTDNATWHCQPTYTNDVLTGAPLHAGITAGIFSTTGAGLMEAHFDNVVFEAFSPDAGPCAP